MRSAAAVYGFDRLAGIEADRTRKHRVREIDRNTEKDQHSQPLHAYKLASNPLDLSSPNVLGVRSRQDCPDLRFVAVVVSASSLSGGRRMERRQRGSWGPGPGEPSRTLGTCNRSPTCQALSSPCQSPESAGGTRTPSIDPVAGSILLFCWGVAPDVTMPDPDGLLGQHHTERELPSIVTLPPTTSKRERLTGRRSRHVAEAAKRGDEIFTEQSGRTFYGTVTAQSTGRERRRGGVVW
jgi:hypothetical protein